MMTICPNFPFVSILVTSNVWMKRKGGSRTRFVFDCFACWTEKTNVKYSSSSFLSFMRSLCRTTTTTPPMLVSLRVFLLLLSVVHRHSSLFFVIRVVVFYLLLYVNIEFLLRQKKEQARGKLILWGSVCVMWEWRYERKQEKFLIRIHRRADTFCSVDVFILYLVNRQREDVLVDDIENYWWKINSIGLIQDKAVPNIVS